MRFVDRRRRRRRDLETLRRREESIVQLRRAVTRAQFEAETRRVLRELAGQSEGVRAAVAVYEYGMRTAREAS